MFVTYHNMQKLNKAALKICVIFLALSKSMVALFMYCYFDTELTIGIGKKNR